jgi:hypothetical protein
MQILLNDVLLVILEWDVFKISGQKDSSALTGSHWFHNEGLSFFLGELVLEFVGLIWQNPCSWRKLKFGWVVLVHPSEIPA